MGIKWNWNWMALLGVFSFGCWAKPKPPPAVSMTRVSLTIHNCQRPDGTSHTETLTLCTKSPPFISKANALLKSQDHAAVCVALRFGHSCDAQYSWTVDPVRPVFADFLAAIWGLYCPSDVQANPSGWIPPTGKGPGRDGSLCLPDVTVTAVK